MFSSLFIIFFENVFEKKKRSHFACDKRIYHATGPIGLIVQSYLDHCRIIYAKTKMKSPHFVRDEIPSSPQFCGINP